MKTGRPAAPIALSEADRAELLRRVSLRKGPQDACVRHHLLKVESEVRDGLDHRAAFVCGVLRIPGIN